jgi:hypothetical protein
MKMIKINAEKAFELMYELFKAKPWLNSPGIMTEKDHPFEEEALVFLLTLETADDWGNCGPSARRVANSLLVDFTAKLRGPFSHREWHVPAGLSLWRQAATIVCAEILDGHPHLAMIH